MVAGHFEINLGSLSRGLMVCIRNWAVIVIAGTVVMGQQQNTAKLAFTKILKMARSIQFFTIFNVALDMFIK